MVSLGGNNDQKAFQQYCDELEQKSGKKLIQLTGIRSCDGCTACCKTHAVSEAHTRAGELCQFAIVEKGCGIYGKHPFQCRLYACWWLRGKGEESDRPDRLKIVMDDREISVNDQEIGLINLHEVEPGAVHQPRVQQITTAILKQGYVVCHWLLLAEEEHPHKYERYERRYYFPNGMFTDAEEEIFVQQAEKGSLTRLGQ